MNPKYLWSAAIIFVLSASLGLLLCYTSYVYLTDSNINNLNLSPRPTRTLTIESVDTASRTIVGKPHLDIGPYELVRFTVPTSINIFKQDTILENGVVTGFQTPYVIPFSSLQPGMEVLVALDTSSGKNIVAAGMLVNDLFARE